MGIWAQICFQNGGVTQAGSLMALNDEPLAIAITQIYNDACAERMKESGGRINCMATLPYWDKDAHERGRCAASSTWASRASSCPTGPSG